MKLIAEIGAEKQEIELRREGKKVFAEIGGRQYELEVSEVEPNVYLFKREGEIYEVYAPSSAFGETATVSVKNHEFDVKIVDPKRLRGSNAAGGTNDGSAEIKTAMPGKIVRVLVAEGAEVSAGDGIIIVEAMKMQNEMKTPKDGIVKTIRFGEGATVNAGEILAVIE